MSDESFIPTKCSLLKRKSEENFQIVTYKSYKPKKKIKVIDENASESMHTATTSELNMKQAKHEVIKFGMSGFDSHRKEEAKVQLAIKLGR